LLADGRWEPLAVADTKRPAELAPGARLNFIYPEIAQAQNSVASTRPLMVRFYDSAGVSFGQISLLNPPPQAKETLQASYADGKLVITPPANASGAIRTSWLLWPVQDGTSLIRMPQKFETRQPSALHIEWRPGMKSPRFDTGIRQPAAMLLHETASGFLLQTIPGGLQANEQRTYWLNQSRPLYVLALLLGLAALLAALLPGLGAQNIKQKIITASAKDKGAK
jgi:hypothetical protein